MGQQRIPAAEAHRRRARMKICRLAGMIALAAMLAGCDKCGDWWSPTRGEAQVELLVCRDQAPPPQAFVLRMFYSENRLPLFRNPR